MRQYTEHLYAIARENRELLAALAGSHLAGRRLQDALQQLERMGDRVAERFGFSYDTAISVRAAFTMVIGMAIFEQDLFPNKRSASRKRIVDELTQILIGAARQPRPQQQ